MQNLIETSNQTEDKIVVEKSRSENLTLSEEQNVSRILEKCGSEHLNKSEDQNVSEIIEKSERSRETEDQNVGEIVEKSESERLNESEDQNVGEIIEKSESERLPVNENEEQNVSEIMKKSEPKQSNESEEQNVIITVEESRSSDSTSDYISCLGSLIAQIVQESKNTVIGDKTSEKEDRAIKCAVSKETENDELSGTAVVDSLSEIPVLTRSSVLSEIVNNVIEKTSSELLVEIKGIEFSDEDVCDGDLTEDVVKKIVNSVIRKVLSDVSVEVGENYQSIEPPCYMSDTELLNHPIMATQHDIMHSQSAESFGFKIESEDSNKKEQDKKSKGIKKKISQAFENAVTKLAKKNLMEACAGWIKRNIVRCCLRCSCHKPSGIRDPEKKSDSLKAAAKLDSSSNSSSNNIDQNKCAPFSRWTPSNETLYANSSSSEISVENDSTKPVMRKRKEKQAFSANDSSSSGRKQCSALPPIVDPESDSISPKSSDTSSNCKTTDSNETEDSEESNKRYAQQTQNMTYFQHFHREDSRSSSSTVASLSKSASNSTLVSSSSSSNIFV